MANRTAVAIIEAVISAHSFTCAATIGRKTRTSAAATANAPRMVPITDADMPRTSATVTAVVDQVRRVPGLEAVALAWGSHVLLDWLGRDTKPPFGIMALWPFSYAHYQSGLAIFPPTSRRYWLAEFWVVNLKALGIELLILAPLAALVVWRYRRQ